MLVEGSLDLNRRNSKVMKAQVRVPATESRFKGVVFVAILVLYIILALTYTSSIPLGEAPDEAPHFSVMVYIVRHFNLPVGPEEHEGFQPPLYYILGATLAAPFDLSRFAIIGNPDYDLYDPCAPKNLLLHTADEFFPYAEWVWAWRLIRFLSTVLGAITLWAIYRLGLLLFPRKPYVALVAAAITAFTPEFLFITSVINNDNLATSLAALALLYGSHITLSSLPQVRSPPGNKGPRTDNGGIGEKWGSAKKLSPCNLRHSFFLLGILWGLGVLTKVSLLTLGVFIAGVSLLTARQRLRRRSTIRMLIYASSHFSLAIATMLAVSGWWFVRNLVLYGDPLGWSLVLEANALRTEPLRLDDYIWLAKGLYRSWWLAWIGISLPGWVYALLGMIPAAAIIGWAKYLLSPASPAASNHPLDAEATSIATEGISRGTPSAQPGHKYGFANPSPLWGVMGLYATAVIMGLLRWTATVLGTDQARLLYPILPVIALFIAGGLDNATTALRRILPHPIPLWGVCSLLLALAIISPWAFIRPIYAPPPYTPAPEGTPVVATFGDLIALQEFELPPGPLLPGKTYDMRIVWRSLKASPENYWLHIKLVDEEGQEVWSKDGSPTAGRDTTDRWPGGMLIPARHRLRLPAELPPGRYKLTIGLHRFGTWEWLPVIKEGMVIGDVLTLGEVEIAS